MSVIGRSRPRRIRRILCYHLRGGAGYLFRVINILMRARPQYVETFIVHSWAEHLSQHERFTRADRALEE